MADQYDDELRGVLFRNSDKQDGDKRPDYKGNLTIGGTKYELAAWIRTAQKTGRKFMSLQLEVPQARTQGAAPAPTQAQAVQAAPVVPPEEDIPFVWEGPILDLADVKVHVSRW